MPVGNGSHIRNRTMAFCEESTRPATMEGKETRAYEEVALLLQEEGLNKDG